MAPSCRTTGAPERVTDERTPMALVIPSAALRVGEFVSLKDDYRYFGRIRVLTSAVTLLAIVEWINHPDMNVNIHRVTHLERIVR